MENYLSLEEFLYHSHYESLLEYLVSHGKMEEFFRIIEEKPVNRWTYDSLMQHAVKYGHVHLHEEMRNRKELLYPPLSTSCGIL